MSTRAESSLISTSLASASSLVLLQLVSRVFTFVLNQLLVRLVSPQVFGTAAIQFELLLSTILFLSREGTRNALLRAGKGILTWTPIQANVALLPVLFGIPITIISTVTYLYASSDTTTSQPHFTLSVFIYALAAFCELLSEPLYIRAQNELRFDVRVRIEGTAVFAKTITAFMILVSTSPQLALVAFAAGQAAYGFTMLLGFLYTYVGSAEYWPKKIPVNAHGNTKFVYFDGKLLSLAGSMTTQSVFKHFLTEGDKFLVSRLSPLEDQGGYAVASNYGSLVARIVFQPIEETARVFFSKTLSSETSAKKEGTDNLKTAGNVLSGLLLAFSHLLCLLVTFAPPYLPLALRLALPSRYLTTSAPAILHTYIYYIPTMAFNGVLEAFFASTATTSHLRAQSWWMVVFSLMFVFAAIMFTQNLGLGDSGLVWANVLNLWLRAAYAWRFVRGYFMQKGAKDALSLWKCVPPIGVLGAFILSAVVTRTTQSLYQSKPLTIPGQLGHILVGAGCVLGCLATCFLLERSTFRQLHSLLRRR
ncbi:Rft protein-domain-containing protein [Irpex rosettiformis]|uniref:Rft protein-domain-containing protein n=1 Tax=Irpex rosettiformis TaxID=378272 RepID=A0ACB8TYW5_9APHY|nr:Rft protein-domain-containing protein [Irpex rosettiformis]